MLIYLNFPPKNRSTKKEGIDQEGMVRVTNYLTPFWLVIHRDVYDSSFSSHSCDSITYRKNCLTSRLMVPQSMRVVINDTSSLAMSRAWNGILNELEFRLVWLKQKKVSRETRRYQAIFLPRIVLQTEERFCPTKPSPT